MEWYTDEPTMNIYLTTPVAFILYLNIIIDGIQSNNSNDEGNPVTPDPLLSKISKQLIQVYPKLEHHKGSPLYEVAVRELQYLAQLAAELEQEFEDGKSKIDDAEQQLSSERRAKLTYMSLIDMKEVATNFIKECYPPWMPSNNPQLDEDTLRTVLLNVENPRVLRLQRILIKNKVSENKFIKDLMRYMRMSKDKARLQLSSAQRKRAYVELEEKLESNSDKVILEFLREDDLDLSPAAVSISTSSPEMSEDAIRRAVNEMRAGFRLVEIPDYVEETDDIELTKKEEFKNQVEATQITFSAKRGSNAIKKMPVLKEVQAGITKL